MKKLLNEFVKNLKLMFRNWTSLSLLVIAPLIFILLIGFAFSSDQIKGIDIGIITEDRIDIQPIINYVEEYGSIKEYGAMESCLDDLQLQRVHICLGLENIVFNKSSSDNGELPTGKVNYYYDNTRKSLSLTLIKDIQEFFGLKAEQISIEGAESIIESIQRLISFINERKVDIDTVKEESKLIKSDLIDRKEKLIELRDDFLPSYNKIKELQSSAYNYSVYLNESAEDVNNNVVELIFVMDEFNDSAFESYLLFKRLNETIYNSTQVKNSLDDIINETLDVNDTIDVPINDSGVVVLDDDFDNKTLRMFVLMGILKEKLVTLNENINNSNYNIQQAVTEIDLIIANLDNIKSLLDDEIIRTELYIERIDGSIKVIDEVSKELDEKLSNLEMLNPEMAEKLVKPIVYEYTLLLEDIKNIEITFPMLVVMIIMFIALLFSNIVTLMELHNKAFFRNMLAPVDDVIFVLGIIFTSVLIVFFQVLVLFTVSQYQLGINILPIFWAISFVSLLLILFFVLIGVMFAYLFKNVQTSILITTFTALILFLFSNSLAPIEVMPAVARFISNINPLVLGQYIIKQIQLFGTSFVQILPQILLLIIYICILFIIVIYLAKSYNRRRE